MDQTVKDLYLLYLIQFNNKSLLDVFHKIRKNNGIEIALINSTQDLLVSDELVEFLDRYLTEEM